MLLSGSAVDMFLVGKDVALQVLERLEAQGWVDDEIVVSVELRTDWFDAVVNDIKAVDDSIARVTAMGKSVDYMLIVGGFGASPYLIAKLRDAFSHPVDEVVCPGVPSQAVLKGGGSLLHPVSRPIPPSEVQVESINGCCLEKGTPC